MTAKFLTGGSIINILLFASPHSSCLQPCPRLLQSQTRRASKFHLHSSNLNSTRDSAVPTPTFYLSSVVALINNSCRNFCAMQCFQRAHSKSQTTPKCSTTESLIRSGFGVLSSTFFFLFFGLMN